MAERGFQKGERNFHIQALKGKVNTRSKCLPTRLFIHRGKSALQEKFSRERRIGGHILTGGSADTMGDMEFIGQKERIKREKDKMKNGTYLISLKKS